ncbi:hypothetical protein GGX14DRAFT_569062 [Mycena pura]|uniref:Uncharacterized protein n=1 Tax=Mycena pura TaxID=153505 RepID=A0AAD6VF36_9AGAR|nr:hypothetical protein GGX14DRAFT_569062 [Mycena pura]
MEDSRDARRAAAAFKSRLTEASRRVNGSSPLLKAAAPDDVSSLDFMLLTRPNYGALLEDPNLRLLLTERVIGLDSTALDARFDPKGPDRVAPCGAPQLLMSSRPSSTYRYPSTRGQTHEVHHISPPTTSCRKSLGFLWSE